MLKKMLKKCQPILFPVVLLLALPFTVLSANAASTATGAPRISSPIDSSRQAALPGNVPSAFLRVQGTGIKDMGEARPDLQLTSMSLRFNMSAQQQSALGQLLSDLQDRTSPRFHQWLTPEQFGAQFGMAPSDLAKIEAWLTAQGFTVTEVARGGTFVRFSGTVTQAEAAFHTSMHTVVVDGEQHVTNINAPSLPSQIAGVTSAITGLSDFRLKPRYHAAAPQAITSDTTSETAPAATAAQGVSIPHPNYTSSVSGNNFVVPQDFYTIYDENTLLTGGLNGSGVTVAVVGQSDITLTDVANFRSLSGLSVNTPTVKLYGSDPGTPSTDDYVESMLDVEWSGAAAPSASILFVNSRDVIDGSLTDAIDNNLAPIISDSYGECESAVGSTMLNYYNGLMQQANAQGITVVAAAGDSGATDCDYDVVYASDGLAVDFPAALPTVTGIGGTTFYENGATYWSTTNASNGGSALSYIPEVVWNEDSTAGLDAGGGGASQFFTKPAWQVGTGVPADFSRDVPDVSLNADNAHDPYLICTSGYCTSGFRNSSSALDAYGGTSFGAPIFSGLLAIVVQKTGARLGNANPVIYALANSAYSASVFHDITLGSNASPCVTGSTGCPNGGNLGYTATTGYDLASGWGSVDVYNLVNDWQKVAAIGTTGGQTASTTTLTANPTSATAGNPIVLSVTVSPTSGSLTPTGSVQFLVDNAAVGSAVALASGTATYSLATGSLASGPHTVTAAYSGDTVYAGSKSAISIDIISSSTADFTLTPTTASLTVKSGGTGSGIPFTVSAVNGFTGAVNFSASTTSQTLDATATFNPAYVTITSSKTSGTTTLTLLAYSDGNSGAQQASLSHPKTIYGAGLALAGVLFLVLPRRRRMTGLLAVVLSVMVIGAVGCETGTENLGRVNASPGTYTILVTATGTSSTGAPISHNSTVTLVVQ